jgi:hypothetical protein
VALGRGIAGRFERGGYQTMTGEGLAQPCAVGLGGDHHDGTGPMTTGRTCDGSGLGAAMAGKGKVLRHEGNYV